ncbi:MAG TPA: M48 family metallopeptidase, partial [Anaerolineales bacterium]|nr:M48 family metallopeptidase [Anaerolineales bacterium]HNC90641.1 M48 family metallopeptidase [Anaerolineales bacterium]HNE68648.1 M48 family metallopeptidase [Anaerolineales bacterium]
FNLTLPMTALDLEKQKQAKEYSRINRRLWLVDTLFGVAYALAWLFLGWSISLREWLHQLVTVQWSVTTGADWLIIALYVAVFGGISAIINLPLSYYSGFVLPHRFGQSNQSLKDWLVDQVKGLAIGAPLGLIMLELMYLALRLTGDAWWLWVAGGLLLFNILVSNLAPVLIMPLFNKYVPLGEEHKELEERLLALAERANTKVKGVFKFDMSKRTKAANAALTGLGNTRRIILGDTLITEFTLDEIETVLAHELGHHVHKDIPFLIAFGTVSTTLSLFIASLALDSAVSFFSFTSPADIAALPALMLILTAYGLLTSPVNNAISRWRENMADDYALSSTQKGEAFASAFTRLANQNLGEIDPEKWVVFMFYSHPPLGERIEKAKRFAA